jgi:hypothetical protein
VLNHLKKLCLVMVCFAFIAIPPKRAESGQFLICPLCWALAAIPPCNFPPGEKIMLYMKCPNICGTREICVFDVGRYIVNKAKETTLAEQKKIKDAEIAAKKKEQQIWGESPVKMLPSPPDNGLGGLKKPDSVLNIGKKKQDELLNALPAGEDLIDLTSPSSCLRSIEEVSQSNKLDKICGTDKKTEQFRRCATEYVIGTALLYGYNDPQGRGSAKSQYSPSETTRKDWCLKAVLQQQNMNCAAASVTYLSNIPAYGEHLKKVMSEIIKNSMKPCIDPATPVKDNPTALPGCVRQDLVNLNALKQERVFLKQTMAAIKSVCDPVKSFEELNRQDSERLY